METEPKPETLITSTAQRKHVVARVAEVARRCCMLRVFRARPESPMQIPIHRKSYSPEHLTPLSFYVGVARFPGQTGTFNR